MRTAAGSPVVNVIARWPHSLSFRIGSSPSEECVRGGDLETAVVASRVSRSDARLPPVTSWPNF